LGRAIFLERRVIAGDERAADPLQPGPDLSVAAAEAAPRERGVLGVDAQQPLPDRAHGSTVKGADRRKMLASRSNRQVQASGRMVTRARETKYQGGYYSTKGRALRGAACGARRYVDWHTPRSPGPTAQPLQVGPPV